MYWITLKFEPAFWESSPWVIYNSGFTTQPNESSFYAKFYANFSYVGLPVLSNCAHVGRGKRNRENPLYDPQTVLLRPTGDIVQIFWRHGFKLLQNILLLRTLLDSVVGLDGEAW